MEAALNSSLGRTVLGRGVLRIGRATDNALVIQDFQASSRHAKIARSFDGKSYQITDLGSTNGTFVNEQRLAPNAPRVLNPDDIIRIGSIKFTYEMSEVAANNAPTVAASAASNAPTIAASIPTSKPIEAAVNPIAQSAQPSFSPPQAYGNYIAPAQPSPPAFPAPQVYESYMPSVQPSTPSYMPSLMDENGTVSDQPFYTSQAGYSQPGFGQPGYVPPGLSQQKKSNPNLIIIIIAISILLIVGGTVFYFLFLPKP